MASPTRQLRIDGEDASGKLKLLDTWTKEQREAIKARLKATLTNVLPPHLLPCSAAENIFLVQAETVVRRVSGLKDAGHKKIPLGLSDRKHKCIPWSTLGRLERYYFERRPNAVEIAYDKLPTGPDDHDPERIAYARSLQIKLVPEHLLGFEPEAQA